METAKIEEIKKAMIAFGKKHNACAADDDFQKVSKSENMKELCDVIKTTFNWCTMHHKDLGEIVHKYKEEFSKQDICYNESVSQGYMFYGSSTVMAYGSATVIAYDSANVEAYGSATVEDYGVDR